MDIGVCVCVCVCVCVGVGGCVCVCVCHTCWTALDKWQHSQAYDSCPTPQRVNTNKVIMNDEHRQPLSR